MKPGRTFTIEICLTLKSVTIIIYEKLMLVMELFHHSQSHRQPMPFYANDPLTSKMRPPILLPIKSNILSNFDKNSTFVKKVIYEI